MEPALRILLLMLAASTLDVGDCGLFRTTIRQRRDVLANATTTFDHVYTIQLPGCRSCAVDVSRPRARVFEARDEAPGDKQFEHVLDHSKPVVFTHRINIPPQACGCGDVSALQRRLQALEKEVANLRKQCSNSQCCGSGSAPDCGAHGTLSPSGCTCVCEEGWRGPTCSEPSCPPSCRPPRGECSGGRCVCRSGYTGPDCSQEACPADCNDQGRCIDDRCVCFPGYTGYGCTEEEKKPCPDDCKGHGECIGGKCVCQPGYSGPRCGGKACPNQCSSRGRCVSGKCACKDGFTGEDCSVEIPVALRLRMKKILETKATVEWDLPKDNVDAWVITFRPLKEEDGRLINKLGGSKTSFEQTGLASGQEYEVTLQAHKDKQLGAAITRTFTTMIDSPQNLRVVSATNTTLELGWKRPLAAIDRYQLNYSSATGRRSQVVVPAGNSQTVLTGLEAGVEHTISLVGERGPHRSKAAATRGTTVIDSPRDLRTVAVTDSTISLQWERSVAQVDLYRISYTTRNSRGGELTVSGQDRTATLKGLEKGTKYTISLVGEQGKMKSEAVITTATTESLAHRELAGSHSSRTLAANGSQSIQDISKAISRRIAVAGLPADRGAVGHPAVRHHTAFGRKPFRSPRVRLTVWPPKPLPTDDQKEPEGRRSPNAKAQHQSPVGTGKLGSPGRRVIVSPGSNTMSSGRNGNHGSPGTKTTPWGKDQRGGSPGRVPLPGGTIHRARSPETIPTSKGKYGLGGLPGPHPRSRVRAPGIVPTTRGKPGSPGSVPRPRGQKEPDVHPSLNRVPGTPLDGQQVSKGAGNPPQSGGSETTPHGIPGEEQNVEFETSSQISSQTQRPPLVISPRHLTHPSSPEQTGLVVWNATSNCAQLSWEVAGSPFDRLVLAYQDSLTQVVQAKLVLRGSQQTANITGLIVGKSYDLYLYGSSLGRPLQPVNVTRFSVRGLDSGPVTANKETEDLQTMPAGVREEGVEEEEEDEDVDEEEIAQEELEGEVTTPSTAEIPESTLRPSASSENQTPWWTPTPFKDSHVTSQSLSTSGLFEAHGPPATPNPGVDYNAMLQTATDDTLLVPPTASTDQTVNFSNVLAREVKDRSLRLSWKVVSGAFDSFVVRYQETAGSAQWLERQIQGRYRSVLLKGLKAGTEYSLQLYGVRKGQRTEPYHLLVTTVSTEKIKTGTVGKLDTFVVSNITEVSFLLTWTTEAQFDSFLIHYRAEGSRDVRKVRVAGELRSSIITGLQPSTKYTLQLYGVSSGQRTKPITTTATTDRSTLRLGSLSTPTVTSNSVRLSWTTDRTFDTFLIQYRVQGSQETRNVTVAGGKRVYLIRDLRPSTQYIIYVYGISGSVQTLPLTTQVTTTAREDKGAPSLVRLGTLSTPTVTSNSVRLSWTTDRTFDSFLIQYRVQGSQETRNITVAGGKQVYLIGGLRPSTRYTIHLYGISGSLQTQPLSTQVTTADPEDKDAPSPVRLGTLSTTTITSNSVRISWTTDRTFDSFLIQYRVQGSQETRNITVAGGKRVYLIGSLRPATRYTIHLYGISGSLQTQPLTTQVTTADLKRRDQPSKIVKLDGLSFSNVTDVSFQLSWRAEKVFDSFLVVYGVQGSEVMRNLSVSGERRLVVITGLRPSTTYTVRVYGVSAAGRTKSLTTLVTTKEPSQVQPSEAIKLESLPFSNVTTSSFRISWRAEQIFDTFFILYGVQGSDVTKNISMTGDRRFAVLTGLRPATTYTIRLYGVSASGRTEPITTVVTTKATTDKPTVRLGTLLTPTVRSNSVRLSWTTDRTFDSFLIQYRVQGSQETRNVTVAGGKRVYLIRGLHPSTRYIIYLYGISGSLQTQPLSTQITTSDPEDKDASAPMKLGTLSPPTVSSNSVRLSWTTDRTFDSFLIQYRVQGSQETRNVTVAGGKRVYLIRDLRPSTRYIIYLYGIAGSLQTQPLTTQVTTADPEDQDAAAPTKLGTLSPPSVTSNSVRLSWTTDRTFDSFLIQYSVQGSQETQNITVTGGKRVYLIRGLRPSTKYTIYLYGILGSLRTQPLTTQVTTAAPEDKAPAAPMKLGTLSPPIVTSNSVHLSWTTDRTFDSFLIQYRVQGTQETRNITVTSGKRVYLIRGLHPSTKYTIYLYGISGPLRTQPLTTQVTTAAPEDKAPASLMKLGTLSPPIVTSNSVHLSWTTDRTFDSFLIQYRVQGTQETRNITVTGGKQVYLIRGLRPSTRYTIHLYGISGSLRTQPLTTQVTTAAREDKDAPSPVRLGTLSTPTVTSNSVRLSWTTDRTFDSFLIQYRVQGSQETRNITVAGGKRVYLIGSLRPSTRYTIHLYGISGSLQTQPLSTQVTTSDPEDKDAPLLVKLGTLSTPTVTSNSVRLSWTTDRTFDSFLIQYRVQGSQETRNLTVAGGKRVYLISGLRPSTRYTIHLYGISGSLRTQPLSTQVTTAASEDPTALVRLGTLSTPTVTSNSAHLSWTTDKTFDSFLIQYRVQGSQETRNITVASGKRVYLIGDLRPSTRYVISLYGILGSLRTQPLTTQITTAVSQETGVARPSKKAELGGLSAMVESASSVRLSWEARKVFDSFVLQYRPEGTEDVRKVPVKGSSRSRTITGLRPNSKYTFYLYGVSGGRHTKPISATVITKASMDTNGARPSQLSKLIRLSGNNVTENSLQVHWAAEQGFDSFLIQYGAEGSADTQNITAAGDQHSAFITGLKPATAYRVSLIGVSGNRRTKPLTTIVTTTVSRTVEQVKSIMFGSLSFSNITANSLQLSWEMDGTFDSFLIEYVAQGSDARNNFTVAGDRRSAYITGLKPATNYTIYLYGVSRGKLSRPLEARLTITAIPVHGTSINSLGGVSVSDVNSHRLRLSWTVEEGAFDSFLVRYGDTKGRLASKEITASGDRRHITLTDLSPGTEYQLSLYGILDGQESNAIPITALTAQERQDGMSFTDITDTSVTISWAAASEPVDTYKIFYVPTVQGDPKSRSVDGARTSITLSGLQPGAQYEVNLVPMRGRVESPPILGRFTTAPDPPSHLQAINVSETRAVLEWKPATAPIDHYIVSYKARGIPAVRRTVPSNSAELQLVGLRPRTMYTAEVHSAQGTRTSSRVRVSFTTVSVHIPFPKNCEEELSNGRTESNIVTLYLNGNKERPIRVFCDMSTDGGGWMVFQRRMNGKLNFTRSWKDYVAGFGDLAAEHWLGLENLHQLTSQERFELRVDLRAGGESVYATYDNFVVGDAAVKYQLGLGKYAGTAGNSLAYHRGSNFTTVDEDNDNALTNCAVSYRGGWWYQNCHRVNLNGEYGNNKDHQGVNWFGWKGFEFSIPFAEMKMRPHRAARTE
ncbi:tenascin-X-like isoform X4 [Mobula birostris]|uniref:tenascin-X-like isoform X4 n=1 Tax=Mobula birostris TaxID=1983395 RepID=UPI003B2893F1